MMSENDAGLTKIVIRMRRRAWLTRVGAYVFLILIAFINLEACRDIVSQFNNFRFGSRYFVDDTGWSIPRERPSASSIVFRPSLTPPAIAGAIADLATLFVVGLLIYVLTAIFYTLIQSANQLDRKLDALIWSGGDVEVMSKLSELLSIEDYKPRLLQ